jgi:hypothetical protein
MNGFFFIQQKQVKISVNNFSGDLIIVLNNEINIMQQNNETNSPASCREAQDFKLIFKK